MSASKRNTSTGGRVRCPYETPAVVEVDAQAIDRRDFSAGKIRDLREVGYDAMWIPVLDRDVQFRRVDRVR